MADMTDILNMVRSGRLTEATDAIQDNLKGSSAGPSDRPPTDDAEGRPMKDVTPTARALPDPTPKPKRAKTVRPRKAAWHGESGRAVTSPPLPEGGTWLSRQGALPYRVFVPGAAASDAPLIVMLHGCTQTPEDFAAGTAICAAADAVGAHAVFPEQGRRGNANLCWNWFEPTHQARSGEAEAIVSVTQDVLAEIGAARTVHVAGLSAGGAMAAILGANYPEVFASVAIHSGLPVGSARDVGSAFSAMGSGGQAAVPLAVPAIVFHGTSDRTVAPANGAAFLSGGAVQADTRAAEQGGRSATVYTVDGALPVELWEIDGLGHAWSGGDSRGSYADPVGPDATAEMLRFFAQAH
ncbi:PHB depolymerase family esterase [Jannaschia sp.]|nr:PHB depolymerase family esterase [Jannaschia sp.]